MTQAQLHALMGGGGAGGSNGGTTAAQLQALMGGSKASGGAGGGMGGGGMPTSGRSQRSQSDDLEVNLQAGRKREPKKRPRSGGAVSRGGAQKRQWWCFFLCKK